MQENTVFPKQGKQLSSGTQAGATSVACKSPPEPATPPQASPSQRGVAVQSPCARERRVGWSRGCWQRAGQGKACPRLALGTQDVACSPQRYRKRTSGGFMGTAPRRSRDLPSSRPRGPCTLSQVSRSLDIPH